MAITLSIAIIISTTALSIAPMLGSKLLNKKSKSKIVIKFEKLFDSFGEFYSDKLVDKRPKTIVWFMIFVVIFAGLL